MKSKTLQLILFFMSFWQLGFTQNQNQVSVVNYNSGTYFTSITVDILGNVWAGTSKAGIYRLDMKANPAAATFDKIPSPTNFDFNTFNIQTMAADSVQFIWAGHNGTGGSRSPLGGVERIDINTLSVKHFGAVTDVYGLKYEEGDGLSSRNTKCIAVDKNNNVWTAHSYTDLLVSGVDPVYDPTKYYVSPGGLASKTADAEKFIPKGTRKNKEDILPFPAYTATPPAPISATAGTRICNAVAYGKEAVWLSVYPYEFGTESRASGSHPARLLQFDLQGVYTGKQFTPASLNIKGLSIFNGIYVTDKNDVWVTLGSGKGMAIKRRGMENFTHVPPFPQLFPNGMRFNGPQVVTNIGDKIVIGTNMGLLVYTGDKEYKDSITGLVIPYGWENISKLGSYYLITTNEGLPSNNIFAVVKDKNGFIWAATDKGVVRVLLPPQVEVNHLIDPSKVFEKSSSNYYPVGALVHKKKQEENELPMIAADGSKATVFRIETKDFDGYYNEKGSRYELQIYDGLFHSGITEADKDEFGAFEFRPVTKYIDRSRQYVDVLYQHPKFINATAGQSDGKKVSLIIKDKQKDQIVFSAEFKIVYPPVLMVHGVWSSVQSFEKMESGLLQSGTYKDFQLLRIFHPNPIHPESEDWAYDERFKIPDGVDKLLLKCAKNKLSAGKVDVLGHSRGGMMTRLYTQGNYFPYRNDINKLITFNTPHFGSQQANWVWDPRTIDVFVPTNFTTGVPPTFQTYKFPFNKIARLFGTQGNIYTSKNGQKTKYDDDVNGAKQLRVNSKLVVEVLNGPKKENDKTLKHAVQTIHKYGNVSFWDVLDEKIKTTEDIDELDKAGLKATALIWKGYVLMAGMAMDEMFTSLFDGESNDIIVPFSSQGGGLTGNFASNMHQRTGGRSIAHSNSGGGSSVIEDKDVIQRAVDLLKESVVLSEKQDPNASFTKKPYVFKQLKYNFAQWLSGDNGSSGLLKPQAQVSNTDSAYAYIDFSGRNQKAAFDDSVMFTIKTSSNINDLLVIYQANNAAFARSKYKPADSISRQTVFGFRVPKDELERYTITVMGFTNGRGLTAMDTTSILVSNTIAATIDSIGLVSGFENVDLYQNENVSFKVIGYYNDGVARDITYKLTDSNYVFQNKYLSVIGNGNVRADSIGTDNLYIKYASKTTAAVNFSIGENQFLKQSLLGDLTGSMNVAGKKITLNWNTIQEYKAGYFAVQRKNSSGYDSIGSIKAKGTISNTLSLYSFDDSSFKGDTVYYRLKFLDSTDGIKYSNEVKVYKVVYAPKTVLDEFTVSIKNQKAELKWSMLSEYRNKYFVIQKSSDSLKFDSIGVVKGFGTNMNVVSYAFIDDSLKKGKTFYRIKWVDSVGSESVSSIASINYVVTTVEYPAMVGKNIWVSPNPASNQITLHLDKPYAAPLQLRLTSYMGQVVLQKNIPPNSNSINILLPSVGTGGYVVEVLNKENKKLMLTKLIVY